MDKIQKNLIQSYNQNADERDKHEVADWKNDLCWNFLKILKSEGRSGLIDIGAGTGVHGKFFQDKGIKVICIDLSPAHVEKCLEKGLEAYVLNVSDLNKIGKEFDCAFALNSLLHIPIKFLPDALDNISKVLLPDSLFYWGQYGGENKEGIYEDDHQEPKRFFSHLTPLTSDVELSGIMDPPNPEVKRNVSRYNLL